MNGISEYTDVEEYKQAVEDTSDTDLQLSDELKGTPMGCTVEDLIECAETNSEPRIIVSNRTAAPRPIGASIVVEELHEAADLIETLGTHCIEDLAKRDDGSLGIGFHFD
jgi:hypothetical protein